MFFIDNYYKKNKPADTEEQEELQRQKEQKEMDTYVMLFSEEDADEDGYPDGPFGF